MSSPASAVNPEQLHPALWRASQLARSYGRCEDTGFPALSRLLPGGGWPAGGMVDLHVQQPGIGEVRLLAPALAAVAERNYVLLQPPHAPQALGLASLGVDPAGALWVRSKTTADSMWAAEQVLKSGSVGALIFWAPQIRADSQRRLSLAAQAGETLFFMVRPLAAAQDPSPAQLRLALRPQPGGLDVEFVKRRGPARDERLFLPMQVSGAHRFQPQRDLAPAHERYADTAAEHA